MVNGIRRIAALALCAALLLPALGVIGSVDAAGPGTVIVFTEDFEHDWPGTLPNGWDCWDHNIASDIDYWGLSMYEAVSPGHAAWCAQIGYNSLFQNAMNKNVTRLEGPNATYSPKDYVLRYDTNMDAYMRRPLLGIGNLSSATMTFSYWAMTGNSTTTLGNDYMWVSVTTDTSNQQNPSHEVEIWRQPAANSSGWQKVTVPIPTNSTWLSINFHSGPDVPEGGPFIGDFVDDIVVQGTDDQPPTSRVVMPSALNYLSFPVSVEVSDVGSGMDRVELYYRTAGSGNFQLYAPTSNPTGQWRTVPIPFQVPQEGSYELFSRAIDKWGNQEALKSSADATVIVDTEPPSSMATISGDWGNDNWYISACRIDINAWDDASGIASITYRLDGGAWTEYRGPAPVDSDGAHLLEYQATDRAGNKEAARTADLRIDRTGPQVRFTQADGSVYASGKLALAFEASDPGSGVGLMEASIDGGPLQELSRHATAVDLDGLGNGTHQVVLKVWDNAGNPTEAYLNITVDGSAIRSDLATSLAPLVVAVLTVLSLAAIVLLSRRKGKGERLR